jgi:tetratricopeptide (TPR) repeat protein
LRITDDDRVRFTTFFYEAIRFKEAGQYDQALEAYRMCETIDSLNGGLQSELGQLYAALGNSKAALKATKAAYNSAPDNWWYGINLVSLYAALKQLDKAIDVAGALQRVFPNKEEVYQILSTLYKQAEKPEKAIAALNKLEALTGIDGAISMDKFSIYLGMKQNKKAIAEIDKLSAKFPTDMRYKVLRGDIYMYQELPEKAFEIYKHVESEEPNNPYVYVSLSNYYKQQNNNELARFNVVKALKLDALEVEQKISILGDYVKDMIRDTVKLDETESMFIVIRQRHINIGIIGFLTFYVFVYFESFFGQFLIHVNIASQYLITHICRKLRRQFINFSNGFLVLFHSQIYAEFIHRNCTVNSRECFEFVQCSNRFFGLFSLFIKCAQDLIHLFLVGKYSL